MKRTIEDHATPPPRYGIRLGFHGTPYKSPSRLHPSSEHRHSGPIDPEVRAKKLQWAFRRWRFLQRNLGNGFFDVSVVRAVASARL